MLKTNLNATASKFFEIKLYKEVSKILFNRIKKYNFYQIIQSTSDCHCKIIV